MSIYRLFTFFNFLHIDPSTLPTGTELLIEYKTLLSDWKTYMDLVFEYDTDPVFTDAMRYNQYFNFTQYIMDYSIEFFKALDGSRLSPENYTDPTWANIGKGLFDHIFDDVNKKGQYDKLAMQCAFKQNLLKEKLSIFNLDGGCSLFHPTMTTQGFCHAFNDISLQKVWLPNELMNRFENFYKVKHRDEAFQGAGMAEGKNPFTNPFFTLKVCGKSLVSPFKIF